MTNKSLFQAAILHHDPEDGTYLLVEPQFILATSQEIARTIIQREIPEELLECLEEVQTIVNPF